MSLFGSDLPLPQPGARALLQNEKRVVVGGNAVCTYTY